MNYLHFLNSVEYKIVLPFEILKKTNSLLKKYVLLY